jgi:hypothetical protein
MKSSKPSCPVRTLHRKLMSLNLTMMSPFTSPSAGDPPGSPAEDRVGPGDPASTEARRAGGPLRGGRSEERETPPSGAPAGARPEASGLGVELLAGIAEPSASADPADPSDPDPSES